MSISDPNSLDNLSDEERGIPLISRTSDEKKTKNKAHRRKTDEQLETEVVDGFPPSSEDNAGLISGLLFSYVGAYWWKTRNAKEDFELLEKPSKRITAHYAANRLEKAWADNGLFKKDFLLGVWHCTKLNVIVHAISLCLEEATRVAQPLLLKNLMSYYDKTENPEFPFWSAMLDAALISFLSFITVFIHHPYFHGLLKVGNDTRVGTGVLLYKKALRLSLTSLSETNSGQLIQLLNTDAAKLEQAFLFVHYVWLCPILALFYAFVLWFCFGYCCLTGFAFMMIIVSVQVYYSYKLGRNRKKVADKMDARLKVMSEMINGIKVIKMHGWEAAFADKINILRENEIESVGKSAFYSSMVMGVYFVSSKIGLLIYIVACFFFKQEITTRGVFAASALYNSVRLPFALFLPLGLLFGRELLSTSRRINFFFGLKEFSRTTITNNEKVPSAKEIENGKTLEKKQTSGLDSKPSWTLDDNRTEQSSITLNNVTSVWYDTIEEGEKKEREELEALIGDNETSSSNDEVLAVTSSSLNVVYAIQNFTFNFQAGECYGVIGSVGCGKSSLLLTLLSESRMTRGNLELAGSIAYCSQEPWIFTGTVRDNIVFGSDFDRSRYEQAIELCLLKTDLQQFALGDMTVVGDNGSTLSGGQRARISLARAVYSEADIYLLDDPLSAVDTQVGRNLYEDLIRKFLSDKLVILVTHQIHLINDLQTVLLMKDNSILGTGTMDKLRETFPDEFITLEHSADETPDDDEIYEDELCESIHSSKTENEDTTQAPDDSFHDAVDLNDGKESSKMNNMELRKKGMISFSVYWNYTKEVFRPISLGILLATCVIVTQLMNNFIDLLMSQWLVSLDNWRAENATTYEDYPSKLRIFGSTFDMNLLEYYETFKYCTIIVSVLGVLRSVWFRRAQLSASRALHHSMFNCLLNTQASFFDQNSEGAILNRFNKDIGLTDDMLAFTYFEFTFGALTFLGIVGLVMAVRPIISFACAPITLGFYICRKIYVARSRELKRIESAARSPLNTLITSTIHGLSTIRAFRKEKEMIEKFCTQHDVYMAAYNMGILSARFFGICIDFLVSVFVSTVAFVVVLQFETLTVGEVGLCLVCAVQLSGFFSWIMRQSAELENGMVSVERVLEYTKLESEEDLRRPHDKYQDQDLGATWPKKGEIEFENVFVKYKDTYVLKDLTFVVVGGQKIGVVGRTGAGKSTLIRVLFGLKEYSSGRIIIDGIDLDHISLKYRRGGMSIIPQEPTLFSGTVRENLDPYNQYDDATLWNALDQCELKNSITKENGLNVEFGNRGVNLSLGQRQLFCLARAMIHRSKILVIDEATANVDGMTDACIQKTIRTFFEGSTIITVAHRLHTIMDSNMIMVFEKGVLVEFDKPITLLNDTSSAFAKMAAQSGTANLESLKNAAQQHHIDS